MSVFTYTPDFNAKNDVKPKVSNISFGDGYTQRATFGLNTMPQQWTLTFSNRALSEANSIESFFNSRGGVTSFDWTPPGQSTALKFVCQVWSRTVVKANYYTITAKFEQCFEP